MCPDLKAIPSTPESSSIGLPRSLRHRFCLRFQVLSPSAWTTSLWLCLHAEGKSYGEFKMHPLEKYLVPSHSCSSSVHDINDPRTKLRGKDKSGIWEDIIIVAFGVIIVLLGIKHRISCMIGRSCATELHSSPQHLN